MLETISFLSFQIQIVYSQFRPPAYNEHDTINYTVWREVLLEQVDQKLTSMQSLTKKYMFILSGTIGRYDCYKYSFWSLKWRTILWDLQAKGRTGFWTNKPVARTQNLKFEFIFVVGWQMLLERAKKPVISILSFSQNLFKKSYFYRVVKTKQIVRKRINS